MRCRRPALAILAGLVLLATDRALDRIALADGLFLGRPVAPFDPPLFSPSQVETLERIRTDLEKLDKGEAPPSRFDPELGWCNRPSSGSGEFRYDWAGARIGDEPLSPEKAPGVRRIVAVGCSMTHGEEVRARETWLARVDAARQDIEVANLGVAAYGIDQALLRLERDGWRLEPNEVWLGILPSAALRITTRFRPLLDHWSLDVAFKPRFRLDRGEMTLLPCPARSLKEVARLLGNQSVFLGALDEDPWVSRAALAYAPRGSSWLHESFVGRLLLTFHERTGRDVRECFDSDTGFGRTYSAIVERMSSDCRERGVRMRVLILPGEMDLRQRAERGRGYWEDWSASQVARGVEVLDVSGALSSGQADVGLFEAGGHYTPRACEIVAEAVLQELDR